jgi:hypothetical protein
MNQHAAKFKCRGNVKCKHLISTCECIIIYHTVKGILKGGKVYSETDANVQGADLEIVATSIPHHELVWPLAC